VDKAQEFLESHDVGRLLGVGPQRVTQLAEAGVIPVFGRTPRGVRLFRPMDVERVRRTRARRPQRRGGCETEPSTSR
jgi:DNA-binding transcriptional MerR regulator